MTQQRILSKYTPAIAELTTIYPGGARPVDVVTLDDGRVLVIAEDGIELWPDMDALLASDPDGDFPEMIGFIEYEYEEEPTPPLAGSWRETARFGRALHAPIRGALVAGFKGNVLFLPNGRLVLSPWSVRLLPAESQAILGEIKFDLGGLVETDRRPAKRGPVTDEGRL